MEEVCLAATKDMTAPTANTTIIQPTLFGSQSDKPSIVILNGIPTAVAETEIIAPARKQNIKPLAR